MIRQSLILLASLALCATAYGDVLHLKTGGTVEGEIVEEAADKILIRTKFGVQQIARADIERVEREAGRLGALVVTADTVPVQHRSRVDRGNGRSGRPGPGGRHYDHDDKQ